MIVEARKFSEHNGALTITKMSKTNGQQIFGVGRRAAGQARRRAWPGPLRRARQPMVTVTVAAAAAASGLAVYGHGHGGRRRGRGHGDRRGSVTEPESRH
jgi:hypothetical protein